MPVDAEDVIKRSGASLETSRELRLVQGWTAPVRWIAPREVDAALRRGSEEAQHKPHVTDMGSLSTTY